MIFLVANFEIPILQDKPPIGGSLKEDTLDR
jgi:hypothetical protein